MRRKSFALLALLGGAVGCTSPGGWGGYGARMAQNPQSPPPHAAMYAGATPGAPPIAAAQPPSWSDKVLGALTTNPFVKAQSSVTQTSVASAPNPQYDPIALGFKSGPPNAKLYTSMAELADHGGNTEQARQLYQRALSVEANQIDALLGLARLEDREGNLDAALRTYQQAAAAHPNNPQALNDLALCFARKGQLPTSAQLLEQVVQLQPSKALYRNNLAKVLVELNAVDKAVACQTPLHGPAAANYNVGVLLMQRGRNEEAKARLTTASQIDPSLEAARTLMSELSAPTDTKVVQKAPPADAKPAAVPNAYQAYLAAQNGGSTPTAVQVQLPTTPAPQAQTAPGVYPSTSTTAVQPGMPTAPVAVPGAISPTRVGQAPAGLPPIR